MRIVQAADIAPRHVSGHRTGNIEFQQLLQGAPGALDNFELSLVHNRGSYYTPRHRHNFEQVRYVVAGEFEYAARKRMKAGTLGYFPEGTPYGPQNVGDCITLVLQCGGPSRQGFMSYAQLTRGHEELRKLGTFAQGIFTRDTASNRAPATRKNQDGYEAIWEHVNGRRLSYPKQRYSEPVIIAPEAIDWVPAEPPGVARKICGVFDHNVRIEMIGLAAGARIAIDAARAIQLLFVVAGRGTAEGRAWTKHAAIEVACGERVALTAEDESTVLLIGMAELPRAAAAQAA